MLQRLCLMCPLEMQARSCQADLLAQQQAVPCCLTTLTRGSQNMADRGLHLPSKGSGRQQGRPLS